MAPLSRRRDWRPTRRGGDALRHVFEIPSLRAVLRACRSASAHRHEATVTGLYGMAMPDVHCFGCGASVPATDGPVHAYMLAAPGCWALYGSILERQYANGAVLQLEVSQWLVDAYAAQHATNTDRRNRQSVALHLVSLCAAFDDSMPADARRRLIGHLAHREYPVLEPTVTSFAVTVRNVADAADTNRADVAERWARGTWDAWATHHETVRSWLSDGLRLSSASSRAQGVPPRSGH
jgi:hypothetical protein